MVTPNHTGALDILGLIISDVHPGFAQKIEVMRMPIIGKLAAGLNGVFIDRFSNKDNRNATVE